MIPFIFWLVVAAAFTGCCCIWFFVAWLEWVRGS